MAISIREVAAQAGVSLGTVSSVLNGNVQARIGRVTQERVRRVAAELGYAPNRFARSLGRNRTDTIGLMVSGLRNPFFLELMVTAEEQAQAAGFDVLTDDAFLTRPAASGKLRGWPVDGILMWATEEQTLQQHLGAQIDSTPVVYLGYERMDGASYVALDHYGGARTLMEHLVELGRQRIAYLTPHRQAQTGGGVDARRRAYEDVCRQQGQPPLYPELVGPEQYAPVTQGGWREIGFLTGLALAAAPDRPDAVFCHNDILAIGFYHGLLRGGLQVPSDIAVAGFDGVPEGMYLDKSLTTVVSPVKELCATALALLTGSPNAGPRQIVLPTLLRVGETS